MNPRHDQDVSNPRHKVGVVVVAAGSSRRMGGIEKVFLSLAGKPLVAHSLQTFEDSTLVDNVVLVVSDSARDDGERIVTEFGYGKVVDVVVGGARRQDSVLQGMDRLSDCGIIMVHDGARPFVSGDMISRGLDAMRMASAATAGVPVTDTIKIVDADMVVKSTPDRTTLWAAQTPQVFKSQLLREAHRRVTHDSTDDAAMVEALGTEVKVFMGSYENMKVTTPEDVSLAEAIHAARTRPSGPSA